MTDITNPLPPVDTIVNTWLTSYQAIDIIKHNTGKKLTGSGITYICQYRWEPKGNAYKVGRVWYIRPGIPDTYNPTRSK